MSQNVAPETHIQFNETSFTNTSTGHDTGNHMAQTSLENGDVEKDETRYKQPIGNEDEGDEYTKLVRYISTYNEGGRRKSTASQLSGAGKTKRPWWKCWGTSAKAQQTADEGAFEVPDEWAETDIKTGITTHEVETRRKKVGWNELTTEKMNPILQFLSYFQGPILYGK